jgi:hypothetical protein
MFKLAISFFFAAFVAEAVHAQTIPVGGLCKLHLVVPYANVIPNFFFPQVLALLALFL